MSSKPRHRLVDWTAQDALTDRDIARQIADNPDAAPDMSDWSPDGWQIVHPPEIIDVRAIRLRLDMTQKEFAERFGFTIAAIRDWEQGRRCPEGPARSLLLVIEKHPRMVADVLAGKAA
ncbi:helix-turn-helix domain-containing protein [Inquilinus sp. CAU 1745]|uniref:helix-turn-helix domain-containing protein n=1 Tax=Inquilinus sp. CAU 1745 TaxID=3140369 RepID=UPI00325B67C7